MLVQVRPSEVDAFGVVNNTVYPQYMLHARALLLASLGFSMETLRTEHGIITTSAKMDIAFKSPLRPGDMFYAEVSITSTDGGATFRVRAYSSCLPLELTDSCALAKAMLMAQTALSALFASLLSCKSAT